MIRVTRPEKRPAPLAELPSISCPGPSSIMDDALQSDTSEPFTKRMRVSRSFAVLRGMTEGTAPTTSGRASKMSEDMSTNSANTPEPSGLAKVGRKLASINPLNLFRSLAKTYNSTKDDIIIDNIEKNRRQAFETPVKKPDTRFAQSTTSLASLTQTIRTSASRKSLREQHKLSKRVSDLESQLNNARKALDESLKKASPMPVFPSPHARYTPTFASQSQLNRNYFVPALPTLHSESLLFPNVVKYIDPSDQSHIASQSHLGQHHHTVTQGFESDQDSISSHETDAINSDAPVTNDSSPLRHTFYMQQNTSILPSACAQDITMGHDQTLAAERVDSTLDLSSPFLVGNKHDQVSGGNKDVTSQPTADDGVAAAPSDLQTKHKILEKAIKKAKSAASKKRKSHLDDGDKLYKPDGNDDDDDYSVRRARPQKKRKATADVAPPEKPKKAMNRSGRKLTKARPAAAAAELQPPAQNRHRHSGEINRPLDQIDEDTEMFLSSDDAVATPAKDHDSSASAMAIAIAIAPADQTAAATKAAVLMAPAASLADAEEGADKRTPSPLTRDNLAQHDSDYEWPEDVF